MNRPAGKLVKNFSPWCKCPLPDPSPMGTDVCRQCQKKVWKDIKGTGAKKP